MLALKINGFVLQQEMRSRNLQVCSDMSITWNSDISLTNGLLEVYFISYWN